MNISRSVGEKHELRLRGDHEEELKLQSAKECDLVEQCCHHGLSPLRYPIHFLFVEQQKIIEHCVICPFNQVWRMVCL